MALLKTESNNHRVRWCSPWLHKDKSSPQLKANIWVSLFKPLTDFCYDEALLLCQDSETEWVVWIPDHGEARISLEQFCLMG